MTSSESTTRRRERELADFGEIRACELLRQKGFKVERMPPNFPFFDLMATRGSCRLLVPVKTRNNTRSTGKPKTDAYRLYNNPRHYEAAKKIADFAQAKIFWVAVTVDAKAKIFWLTREMSLHCLHAKVSRCIPLAMCATTSA